MLASAKSSPRLLALEGDLLPAVLDCEESIRTDVAAKAEAIVVGLPVVCDDNSRSLEHELADEPTACSRQGELVGAGELRDTDEHISNRLSDCASVETRWSEFSRVREDLRKMYYDTIVKRGVMITGCGMFLFCGLMIPVRIVRDTCQPIAILATVSGVMMMSLCPVEDVDLDRLFATRPKLRIVISFLIAAVCGENLAHPPYLFLVPTLQMVAAPFVTRWMRWSISVSFFLFFTLIGFLGKWIFIATHPQTHTYPDVPKFVVQLPVFLIPFWYACAIFLSAGITVWRHDTLELCRSGRILNPTLRLYWSLYAFLLLRGIGFGLVTIVVIVSGEIHAEELILEVVRTCGLCFGHAVPPALILVLGRKTLFHWGMRRFEAGRAVHDGAFIAELLDTKELASGDTWWIHLGSNNAEYPPFDHRRNWAKGCVTKIFPDCIIVDTSRSMPQGSDHMHKVSLPARLGDSCRICSIGLANLRCIDWSQISLDLMMGATCNSSAILNHFHLSRPLRPGEKIDFFLSHSWHDDGRVKFETLKTLAEEFFKQNRRFPTFWLDCVCIDQDDILDNLKLLPVNVMACHQMLVLCGPTYTSRLWCVLELCTLFSFMPEEQALERVVLMPLGEEPLMDILYEFTAFDINEARCYDPNEQFKIMNVIGAVGVNRFNDKIRKLATSCEQKVSRAVV